MIELLKNQNEIFTRWRQDIHQHPELGFEEQRTAALVAAKLREWGLDEVHTGIAKTGVVGVLKGCTPSARAIGLRADMDALPMQEMNHFGHASQHPGKMHGCGHDGHTTMLLAAAWYLSQHRDFSGTVHFIFQPAEEGQAGADAMIKDGLFERFPCDRVYGMHNMPGIPAGHIWLREGPMMASSDRFVIDIRGKGGHAAMPQFSVDPTLALSNIILSAQSIVGRNISPLDAAVVSFTDVHAGSGTHNVIPDTASLKGCIRAFDDSVRQLAVEKLGHIVQTAAAVYGAEATFTILPGSYPATVNHAQPTQLAADVAKALVGEENVDDHCVPLSGSEDFSFMLQKVPGCYLFLGNGEEGQKGGVCVHNPGYDFNDAIIPTGASLFVELVKRELTAA
ncbi:M20 aminoacylase family protein [Vibrio proteolyticus]|uniref:Peptidase M20 family protein n=1 Tax=Vibrio proteolyticus NBRC 13287 TaxID=1219065 RepID=U2ZJW4_VIBPR|nr:M20 aminoacylase family protein [Vibrio proteolyticus]GAD68056.1 peptidase M20 family protein [Vibrio proteolyticus NBRC 13287]